jgi:flagellar basal-body rod protein FlgB
MDLDVSILRLASALAAHAKTRQSVIAENVAHADTPGYRARDVADFASAVETGGTAFAARATRPGHMAFGDGANGFEIAESAAFGAANPNGNTVR